ncbi:hypothetical protein AZI86_13265 [Bdellovibrio bacteriovorus]|uniref:Uncharacterized protein n=1 Tax=Bdellovibrio bacteriovorus TaxID=959 RepID=A0A150WJ18_BDEBC|nr:DUF6766 family protein [Bdellovibrio bacteriovorus]KYG63787.1 hypothetical protein AZI86_13265 [Bdellovibrio bacteriovorus]
MTKLKKIFKNNGLSIVMFSLFLVFILSQFFIGRVDFNEDLERHGRPPVTMSEYLSSGHFIEATFENWESEFFQMGLYVILTAFLYQRGSSESNKLPEEKQDPYESQIEELEEAQKKALLAREGHPWPLKAGGVWKFLYSYSLSITLLVLFFISWFLQGYGGWKNENLERSFYNEAPLEFLEFFASSKFWFQTMQNWQSEFVSVALLVVFSIYLRQKGSSQSKDVDAPHSMTEG